MTSREDVFAGVLALVCPYCGATLTINQETVGRPYLTEEKPESIECYASDCEAVWEPNGVPRDAPRWLRYPDLYVEPQRAKERAARAAEPAAEQAHAAAPTETEVEWSACEPDGGNLVGISWVSRDQAWEHVLAWRSEGYVRTHLVSRAVGPMRPEPDAALTPTDHERSGT